MLIASKYTRPATRSTPSVISPICMHLDPHVATLLPFLRTSMSHSICMYIHISASLALCACRPTLMPDPLVYKQKYPICTVLRATAFLFTYLQPSSLFSFSCIRVCEFSLLSTCELYVYLSLCLAHISNLILSYLPGHLCAHVYVN